MCAHTQQQYMLWLYKCPVAWLNGTHTKDMMEAREETKSSAGRREGAIRWVPNDVNLHVGAHAQQQAQVHAHGPDIGSGLAGDPEHHQLAVIVILQQLAIIDGAHAQLALDRRDQWRPLK